MGFGVGGLQSFLQSTAATVAQLVNQSLSALKYTSTQANGSDAFAVTTVGARLRLGLFAESYLDALDAANGVIRTGGSLSIARALSIRNDTGGTLLSVGTSGQQAYSLDGNGNITFGFAAGTGGALSFTNFVDDSATTGNRTVNAVRGVSAFAAASAAITITNSFCVSTSTLVLAVLQTNDATARLANVVPAAGSFVINLTAAATATTKVGWVVLT